MGLTTICNYLYAFNVKLLSGLSFFFYVCTLKDGQPNKSFEGDHSFPSVVATSILQALYDVPGAFLLMAHTDPIRWILDITLILQMRILDNWSSAYSEGVAEPGVTALSVWL